MIKKNTIILFFALLFPLITNAQKTDSIRNSSIEMLARVMKNKVILRWAPNNPTAWLMGNKYGYIVERYTFLKNGKLSKDRNKTILTPSPMKPFPIEKWEKLADTSDFAAVAAQAIYGSDFEVAINKSTDMYSVFNKAKEVESRYTFALHAANHSIDIAIASALSLEDTIMDKSEAYLYRIYIQVPKESMQIDTGKLFVDASIQYQLPKIREVKAQTSGNGVMISWNSKAYERDFTSYIVERSDDGGHQYHALSVRPFVNLGNEASAIPGNVIYLDSIPLYNYLYFYRVRGKSSFAEIGPASDSLKVIAQKTIFSSPNIKSFQILKNKVVLNWEMPDKNNDALQGFSIERASNPQSTYTKLNKTLLSPDVRLYTDTMPVSSNYYVVWALDKQGSRHASLPYFVQLEDSIPPLPPMGLVGTIDTSGLVHLSWKNNPEPDILGYRIFKSYFKSAEFVQVTTEPIAKPTYSEKINLKNLNKYLYFKVIASDTHFNLSGYSKILQIRQPDIIAPSAPAVSRVTATDTGIDITFFPSNSDDVEKYVVYRKANEDSIWTLQKVITPKADQMAVHDSTTENGAIYIYNIVAVDSFANESLPARSVKCKAINSNIPKTELTLNIRKDKENKFIEIKWFTNRTDIAEILIYKSTDADPLSQYVIRPANDGVFIDSNIKPLHRYRYMLKAILKNGSESNFTKVEMVEF